MGYATERNQHQRLRSASRQVTGAPDEEVEPGRFGVIHRDTDDPQDRLGEAKAIYCWLAARVPRPTNAPSLSCESKRRPHA